MGGSAGHRAHEGIEVKEVTTADEMLAELRSTLKGADLLVMAAAVSDYRPAKVAAEKIRRETTPKLTVELEEIPDLIATLGAEKDAAGVFRIGFAAEDSDLADKALEKMNRKGLQAIVANDISRKDIGFGSDDNAGVVMFVNPYNAGLAATSFSRLKVSTGITRMPALTSPVKSVVLKPAESAVTAPCVAAPAAANCGVPPMFGRPKTRM